ncbi:MAG: MBL fold metallo-hydrolase [Patescibacteria group bacterium]|nr:MBL fold metallo-hydrolase [Patescibacteria group bacterium]
MIITWLGHSCFKLQDKIGADGVTLITDPYSKETGLKLPSLEADLVTISHDHDDHNNVSAVKGNPRVINCAGEYDVKGIFVEGIDSFHDETNGEKRGGNIIYRIEIDDISIAHLGDLAHTLDNTELEKLVGTDILLIPVGGHYTLDAKKAVEVISQIEPRMVIPMHYRHPEVKIELDDLEKFIKELGVVPTHEEKLKISKKDLPAEEMELVVLSF